MEGCMYKKNSSYVSLSMSKFLKYNGGSFADNNISPLEQWHALGITIN